MYKPMTVAAKFDRLFRSVAAQARQRPSARDARVSLGTLRNFLENIGVISRETAFNNKEIDVRSQAPEEIGAIAEDQERMNLLIRLLTRHHDELFRFILSMHPHEHDARDILQESSVALCRKIAEYDPAKPFLSWAFGFAYLQVLKFRERSRRGGRLLNQDLLHRLALERAEHTTLLAEQIEALDACMKELPETDQALIRQRYLGKASIETLVEQFGTSRRTLFRNLERVRRLLLDGINRRVASADSA